MSRPDRTPRRPARTRRSTRVDLPRAIALVTGAGSGIGRASALALAARGARVLCTDVAETAARQTAADCVAAGGQAQAHVLDVADREAVQDLATRVEAHHGALDVLVNNAGVGMNGAFLDTGLADWDWILSINLVGVVNCCHAFGRAMVERGRGHVVNISSGLAYTHRSTESAYITTKAGVLALSRSLRADWRSCGVGVTAVCPGIIATPIITSTRFLGDHDAAERLAKAEELFAKRGRPPERVADAVLNAIARNRAVVPVGAEAWLGWMINRLLPARAADRLVATTQRLTAHPAVR